MNRRVASLDGIRGLAILGVLTFHFSGFLPQSNNPVAIAFKLLCVNGWAGVDLFFVLSGFLITGVLLDSKAATNYYRSFYARRILRIFPLYYGTLAVVFLALTRFPQFAAVIPSSTTWKFYVLYLANLAFLFPLTGSIVGHFWSLALEEQFYAIWPFLVKLLQEPRLLILCGIGSAALSIVRICLVERFGPSHAIEYLRVDSVLMGAAATMVARSPELLARMRPKLLPVMCTLALPVLAISLEQDQRITQEAVYPMLALIFGAAVLLAATSLPETYASRALSWAPLVSIGMYSYGIYVLHVPLLSLVRVESPALPRSYTTFAVLLLCSYLSGWLSYSLFEQHFLKLKRYFRPFVS